MTILQQLGLALVLTWVWLGFVGGFILARILNKWYGWLGLPIVGILGGPLAFYVAFRLGVTNKTPTRVPAHGDRTELDRPCICPLCQREH